MARRNPYGSSENKALLEDCNGAIGLFGDNITACRNAAEYLEKRGSYGS